MSDTDNSLPVDLAAATAELMLPGFGSVIGGRIARAVAREWRRNMSKALAAAEQAMGMSREDLAERLEEETQLIPLYVQVLWAAGMNGHDDTMHAMGAAFAAAVSALKEEGQSDRLEDAELALSTLSNFRPRHFRVLKALSEGTIVVGEDGSDNFSEFMPAFVADRARLGEEAVQQCLMNLAGAGLVTMESVWNGTAYPITSLGRSIIHAVIIMNN